MSRRINILVAILPALLVWTVSCSDRPPTANEENVEAVTPVTPTQIPTGNVRNGVSVTAAGTVLQQLARPSFINFDPPCEFSSTMPLQDAPYMNPATKAEFVRGNGAVLNECGNFLVSGFSPPNFLAWNCESTNWDGTKPELPAEIRFSDQVSEVTVKVGSSLTGKTARLVAFNAASERVDGSSTSLTSKLKLLTVSASSRTIKYVRLFGPCVMVADNFRAVR